MTCPICGKLLPTNTDRCSDCGYRVTGAQTTHTSGYYTPPNRTGRKKGCCCCALILVPLMVMLAVASFATVRYVQREFFQEDSEYGFFDDPPLEDLIPESLPAAADEGAFSIRDGAVSFRVREWDGSPVVLIPGTVDGEPVTSLAPGCFRDCEFLTTIILPESVTAIGREAFSGCRNLRGIFLPEGTQTIGLDAFRGCLSLEAIYIPSSVTEIAPGCFDDCAALMYLFYDGDFDTWEALYSDFINPFTTAICTEGSYNHGTGR